MASASARRDVRDLPAPRDADARHLGVPLRGVSEDDAEAMVAGDWKYVYELGRAS